MFFYYLPLIHVLFDCYKCMTFISLALKFILFLSPGFFCYILSWNFVLFLSLTDSSLAVVSFILQFLKQESVNPV